MVRLNTSMGVVLGVGVSVFASVLRPAPAAADSDPARPRSVQVLAYGFPGIDERDLGTVFTADLARVEGAPRVFDAKAVPKRVVRNAVDKGVYRASQTNTVEAGAQFLFVGLGVQQTESQDALVLHSRIVKEVVTLDGVAPLVAQELPAEAVFYLAEVHVGTTVDLTAEADYVGSSQQLSLFFAQGAVSAKEAKKKSGVNVQLRALGLSDFNGEGAFAMTLDDIRSSFRGDPAPIELVFRTLPGRSFDPPKRIERAIDDAGVKLGEGKTRTWKVPPGKYKVFGTSAPDGMTAAWSGIVDCDKAGLSETRRLEATCSVRTAATLTLKNPTSWGLGPEETVNLVVARLPEQIEVADGDMQAVVAWFDRLVGAAVSNSKNCDKMAAALGPLLDAGPDMIKLARRRTEKPPTWLTTYMTDGVGRMTPALEKCASSPSMKVVLDRLASMK